MSIKATGRLSISVIRHREEAAADLESWEPAADLMAFVTSRADLHAKLTVASIKAMGQIAKDEIVLELAAIQTVVAPMESISLSA